MELSASIDLRPRTLVELLGGRAAAAPARCAYRFLSDAQTVEAELTYSELATRAHALASRLVASFVGDGP